MKKENKKTIGLGITGFVLSIIGFVGLFVPYLAIFLSVAGIVFSSLQMKKNQTGLSVAGLVIGILGIISNLFWLAINIMLIVLGEI